MKPKLKKNLSLPSTRRESKWKPSNSLAKKISYELNFPLFLKHDPTFWLQSGFVFPGFLYQFFGLADRAVVTNT